MLDANALRTGGAGGDAGLGTGEVQALNSDDRSP